jgi:uridylate kinase
VKEVYDLGVHVAIMVGGGNIFRGTRQKALSIDRATATHGHAGHGHQRPGAAGRARKAGRPHALQSAIEMHQVAEPFIRRRAMRHLEKGRVVIFAAGTGNPYFSTDTAAALRAMEIKAQCHSEGHARRRNLRRGSGKSSGAKMFDRITYLDVIQRGLAVMDSTAISLCMDNKMPIIVFNMNVPGKYQARGDGRKGGLDGDGG